MPKTMDASVPIFQSKNTSESAPFTFEELALAKLGAVAVPVVSAAAHSSSD